MIAPIEYDDIQGLVRFGYAHLTEACYLLVKVKEPSAVRTWLANAPITSARTLEALPKSALQIAFSRQGLEALRVPPNVMKGFSSEFTSGMAEDENRSRRLGDTAANAPSNWRWGGPEQVPHAVLMLFAEVGLLDTWRRSVQGPLWSTAFEEINCLSTSDLGGREPFGFIDGISQPQPDWEQTRKVPINGNQIEYSNIVCLGEFLLGYPNEYGKYTDRPLLDSGDRGSAELSSAEDQPEKKDLGRNGTYVVMRQLVQDVRGFWQFLDRTSHSNAQERDRLAGWMLGRSVADGTPLVPMRQKAIPGIGTKSSEVVQNQFTYDSDVEGTQCPYGAHIRRGNPRNADIPGPPQGLVSTLTHVLGFGSNHMRDDLIASARFHRILRRGREYGPKLTPEEALQPAPPGDAERGLHFVAINANIQRQFEFVQNAWIMRTKFDGLTEESDPLLGNRAPVAGCPFTDTFSVPQPGGIRRRIMQLPQFVTVRGGAYFFMPGIRALRYLTKMES